MSETEYDLVIDGARLVDGTGAPARAADVAVAGDRVAAVAAPGALASASAARRVPGADLTLAPGFIDAHTHDDRAVIDTPDHIAKVSQGVTSVVSGNCGISLAPFAGDPVPPMTLLGGREWYRFETVAAYLDAVRAARPAVNVAPLVGHTTLRARAMDRLDRPATGPEIERMGAWLEEALDAGCIGMSTGLAYPPAQAAPPEEVTALARRVAARGGLYTTHMRDERAGVVDSVEETLALGREAGLPVVISHHKCAGKEAWGLSERTLARIAEARRGGQRVDLDVYPYTASSTVLIAEWVPDSERVTITSSGTHPECVGRDLDDIAADWGCSVADAIERLQPAGAVYHQMDERDLRRILAFEDAMVASDGLPHDVHPHPRLWGTFPRVLGRYAREAGVLALEEAVRRMSSVPARVFGLEDRGTVVPGAYADLVLFDAASIVDAADFQSPMRPSQGVREVWVNGEPVWNGIAWTGAGPGRVLSRRAG